MKENFYFFLKLDKNQSLMYQLMIILMEEHKKARLGKYYIGMYDGGDSLTFDNESWKKMRKKMEKHISENYKEKFSEMDDFYLAGLFPKADDNLCTLRLKIINDSKYTKIKKPQFYQQHKIKKIKNDSSENKIEELIDDIDKRYYIIFDIASKGYSYQYNGYRRTQDKLQRKANIFLFITVLYYIISWVFPTFNKLNEYLKKWSPVIKIENTYFKLFVFIILWEFFKKIYKILLKK